MKQNETQKLLLFFFLIFGLGILQAQEELPPPPPCQGGIARWTGSGWEFGIEPAADRIVIFDGNFSSTANIPACSVEVHGTAVVTINSAHILHVEYEVAVDATARLVFENNASLIQVHGNVSNTGAIDYKRDANLSTNADFTYWSSPVQGQSLVGMFQTGPFPFASRYFRWDANVMPPYVPSNYSGTWITMTNTSLMEVGRGYIVPGASTFTVANPGVCHVLFRGTPNNGTITTTIYGRAYTTCISDPTISNLIGNPYPSALDADSFLADPLNASVIGGSIYQYAHNTQPSASNPGNHVLNYTTNDYTVYNRLGGVGTGRITQAPPSIQNSNRPNGKIAAGQGFIVQGLTNGVATFTNEMREDLNDFNNQFYKTGGTKGGSTDFESAAKVAPIERHRIWVSVINNTSTDVVKPYKETLIGAAQGATNGYDRLFDTAVFSVNPTINVYSFTSTATTCEPLTIQGRSLTYFSPNSVIPIGYSVNVPGGGGPQQIIFDADSDGMFDTVTGTLDYYLRDSDTGLLHDFPYTHTTASGTETNNTRFQIVFRDRPKLNVATCELHTTALNVNLATTTVTGATAYRWKFTRVNPPGPSATFDVTGSTLNKLSNITLDDFVQYDAEYEVEIAARIASEPEFGNYGVKCRIFTPSRIIWTNIANTSCGGSTPIRYSPNPGSQITTTSNGPYGYRWKVTRKTDPSDPAFDVAIEFEKPTTVSSFNFSSGILGEPILKNTPGFFMFDTEYCFQVAILYPSGNWGAYSDACCYRTIPSPREMDPELKNSFAATAYPNPFGNSYRLDIRSGSTEPVSVVVYDMIGKLIESKTIAFAEAAGQVFGNQYAAGVYNVIVTQGENRQSLKLIKK